MPVLRIFVEPIENSVKFVKTNFFSARTITSIEEVASSLPGWLERKNKRIHQATFQVPQDVFARVEKAALVPLVPSLHEVAPVNLISQDVGSMPYVQYASSKYSVPADYCYTTLYYKAAAGKLHIYDKNRRHLCTHDVSPVKGSKIRLAEHAKEPSTEWMVVAERMRAKYNCFKFQHFINGFKKENGTRHLAKQLLAVERYLDEKRPSRELVSEVMEICCRDWRYKFSQFKNVYDLCAAKHPNTIEAMVMSDVEKRSLESYQDAFEKRCAG